MRDMKLIMENWRKFSESKENQEEGLKDFAKKAVTGVALAGALIGGTPAHASDKTEAAVGYLQSYVLKNKVSPDESESIMKVQAHLRGQKINLSDFEKKLLDASMKGAEKNTQKYLEIAKKTRL